MVNRLSAKLDLFVSIDLRPSFLVDSEYHGLNAIHYGYNKYTEETIIITYWLSGLSRV